MTELRLANLGLRHAKLAIIESLDDKEQTAAYIRENLQHIIDEGLERYDWNFARVRTELTQIDSEFSTWLYTYDLPDDMIMPRIFTRPDVDHRVYALTESDYELFTDRTLADQAKERLACNYETMDLVYTRRVIVVPYLPEYFARAISYLLGYYLALTFGGQERATWALETYEAVFLPQAMDRDRQKRKPIVRGESELVGPDSVKYDPHGFLND